VTNQKLVHGGRVLTDDQKIQSMLASENDATATVHLIISENSEMEEAKSIAGQLAGQNGNQTALSSSSAPSLSPQALAAEALGITPPAAASPPLSTDPNLANGANSTTATTSNMNWTNPIVPNGLPNNPAEFDFGAFNNAGFPGMNPFFPMYNPMMPPAMYPNPFASGSLPGMPGIQADGSLARPGTGDDPAALQAYYDAQQLQYQQMLMMQIQMLQYQQQLLAMQSMSMTPSSHSGLVNAPMLTPFAPLGSLDGLMPTERHIPQAEPDASVTSRIPSVLASSTGPQAHPAVPTARPATLPTTSTLTSTTATAPASYASGVRHPVSSQLHQRQLNASSSSTDHQHTPRTVTETAATRTPSNQAVGAGAAPAAPAAAPAAAVDPAPNIAPLPNLNQVFGVQLRLEINWGLIMKLAFFVFLLGQEGPAWRTALLGIIALLIYLWQVGRMEFLQRSLARYIPNAGAALQQIRDTQLQRLIQMRTANANANANANAEANAETQRRNNPVGAASNSTQNPTVAPASAESSTASVPSTTPANQLPQNIVQVSSSFIFAFVYGFVCSLVPSWRPGDLFQPNRENVGGDENDDNNNGNAGNNRPHID